MKNSEATEQLIPAAKPLRLADRLRLDTCFNAIVQERRILVLHSAHAGVLEHHAGLLIERLQHHGDVTIEHFSSVNSEALLSRMNEVLADLSVDQATRPSAPPSLQRIWVVLDAHTLPISDIQLLIQLLKNFPGAGLTAILAYQGKSLPQFLVDAQGPRLVSWAIEAEPADLADAPTVKPARQLATPPVMAGAAAALGASSAAASAAAPVRRSPRAAPKRGASRQNRMLAVGLLVTLVLSAGGAVLMQPEAASQMWTRAQTRSGEFLVELAQATERVLGAAPTSDASLPTQAEAQAQSEAAPAAPPAAPESSPTETPAQPSPATPNEAAPPAAGETPAAGAAVEPPPAPPILPTPPIPLKPPALPPLAQRDLQWLLKTPDDFYLVGHGVYDNFGLAQQSLRNKSYLANARLVPVLVGATQRHEYLVVTGPFRTQERVNIHVARLDLGPSVKTVTVSDLKRYIALRKAALEAPGSTRGP